MKRRAVIDKEGKLMVPIWLTEPRSLNLTYPPALNVAELHTVIPLSTLNSLPLVNSPFFVALFYQRYSSSHLS